MAQQVDKPPANDEVEPQLSQPPPGRQTRLSWAGIIFFLALIGVVILASTGLLVVSLVQTTPWRAATMSMGTGTPALQQTQSRGLTGTPSLKDSPDATLTATPPIFTPGNMATAPLQIPDEHFVVYEQQNYLYMISTHSGAEPQLITTPGYIYNQAVRPILLPSGQLLYSGDGIWQVDIFNGVASQIAPLAANQAVTSMVLSSDGTSIAWSTEPVNGSGMDDIYAGPLGNPTRVFEQASGNCPCFSVFSFMNGPGKQGNSTLLLTDGQQSLEAIQFGLWSLDITNPLAATPRVILDGDSQQGPLLLAPFSSTLLYSTYEAQVPMPTDSSVPDDEATLNYANSLNVAALNSQAFDAPKTILQKQQQLENNAGYHWVTTPTFTPDGQRLVYVVFSSLAQAPYDRSSALFVTPISGTGKHLSVGKPQLLATSTARLLELGVWLNSHVLTLFADGVIYALDIQSSAATTIVQTGTYARIIAVVGQGNI